MNGDRRRSGYTLVELMVVVSIIGLSFLAFQPAFGRALADRGAGAAIRELVRVGRAARAQSQATLRAYLVFVQQMAGTGQAARVRLLRGLNNSCFLQNWAAIQAQCPGGGCEEDIDFGDPTYSVGGFRVQVVDLAPDGTERPVDRAFCYSPNGLVYTALTPKSASSTPPAITNRLNTDGGAVTFSVYIRRETEIRPPRGVVFPLGGTPRVKR